MTASELAFLALGLVLGVAAGAAIIVLLRSRSPSRDVRLTVTHDAVPKRPSTLSSDAFVTAPSEPARGGPADRREVDRDLPGEDEPAIRPTRPISPVGVPVMRTDVPSAPFSPGLAPLGLAIHPEPDPGLETAAPAGGRRRRDGRRGRARWPGPGVHPDAPRRPPRDALHRRPSGRGRRRRPACAGRPSSTALGRGRAIARTIDLGVLHLPMGNHFWDSFTVEQCREIAGALAARGHRFDGLGGRAHGSAFPGLPRDPGHRVHAAVDPRRIRAWPNSTEIAFVLIRCRIAPEDWLAERAPDLDAEALSEVLGARVNSLKLILGLPGSCPAAAP